LKDNANERTITMVTSKTIGSMSNIEYLIFQVLK
jgi:hypothetical protein